MAIGNLWLERLSQGADQIISSAIRDLLEITEQPSVISFAGGLPAPECFPVKELMAATERALTQQPVAALQYGPTEGYRPLRSWIVDRMLSLGIQVPTEQVLITAGSQQGLDLLGKLLIDPGSLVVVENPTYLGALQAWSPYRPRFATLPMDDDGLDIAELARLLQTGVKPRFLYLVSCFQNPTGITLRLERKHRLVELASEFQLPIVEDDPYGELYYDGPRPPILATIDKELHGELRHVVYLSTLSKLLTPGLRVGWMLAPPQIMRKVVQAKQGVDLHTGSLAQITAYEACREGLLDRHVPFLRATYHSRRDGMIRALERHMPTGVTWTQPSGGLFTWVTLPGHIDSTQLLREALVQEVAFVPGSSFYANGGGANTMRLNFSHSTPEQIDEGMIRLKRAISNLYSLI